MSKFKGSKVEIKLQRGSRSEILRGVIVDSGEGLIEIKSKRSTYLVPLSNVIAIKVLKR